MTHYHHQHRQPTQSEVTIQVEEPIEVQSRLSWGGYKSEYDNGFDFAFDFSAAPALSQSEMLAPMMAVENSWGNLLMPGFVVICHRLANTDLLFVISDSEQNLIALVLLQCTNHLVDSLKWRSL